jgi:hypothetical protein
VFTGAVIAVLVLLSIILTASALFPNAADETMILAVLSGGAIIAALWPLSAGSSFTNEAVWHAHTWGPASRRVARNQIASIRAHKRTNPAKRIALDVAVCSRLTRLMVGGFQHRPRTKTIASINLIRDFEAGCP